MDTTMNNQVDSLADLVRTQLQRILNSKGFVNSPIMRRALSHIVEKSLADAEADLKEYALAMDVLERPSNFDTQTDGAVRTTLHRLRLKLEAYYGTEGWNDKLLIRIPRGHYKASFELASTHHEAA